MIYVGKINIKEGAVGVGRVLLCGGATVFTTPSRSQSTICSCLY